MTSNKLWVLRFFLILFSTIDIFYMLFVSYVSSMDLMRADKSSVAFILSASLRNLLPFFLILGLLKSYRKFLITICVLYGISIALQVHSTIEYYFSNERCSDMWCNYEYFDPHYCRRCKYIWIHTYLAVLMAFVHLAILTGTIIIIVATKKEEQSPSPTSTHVHFTL